MSKKTLVRAVFALGLILVAMFMYLAPTQMSAMDEYSFKSVVGIIGLVFVAYCWLNGKGTTQVATEVGLALGQRAQREQQSARRPRRKPPVEPPAPPKATKPKNSTRPPMRERAVFLYRKPRSEGDIKTGGTSWLGGLPALGDVAWPRDAAGQLMHHAMQIDLAEAGPFLDVPGLPTSGSLAVFVALGEDTNFETKVRYVQHPDGETEPPKPLLPIHDHTTGGMLVRGGDPDALGTLPRWAVDLVRLEVQDKALGKELDAIAPLGTGMNVGAFSFKEHLPNGQDPSYWHSAQLFARSLERAIREEAGYSLFSGMAQKSEDTLTGYKLNGFPKRRSGPTAKEIEQNMRAEIDKFRGLAARARELKPKMETMSAEIMKWAFARDPWDVLTPEELATFKTYFEPLKYGQYGSDAYVIYQCSMNNYSHLTVLADATLKEMVRGPDDVFARLPDAIKQATDTQYQTPGMPHQLFGPPAVIQDAADWHEDDHMLLQIVHDDLIGLRLGDVGHIQLWISPDDLAAGNWDAITSTFEGH